MITKTITGANTKFFVEYANNLIKDKNFANIIADMILDAYESGIVLVWKAHSSCMKKPWMIWKRLKHFF